MTTMTEKEMQAAHARIAELRQQLKLEEQALASGIVTVKPECHTALVQTLTMIANRTKSRNLRQICVEALNNADRGAVQAVADAYYNEAIIDCLDILNAHVQQAKEFDSKLNVVIGEVYISDLEKLLK